MKMEQLQFIETTHSTNVTLHEKCQHYLTHWDKSFNFYGIYTNEQTQGKGLGSNKWLSQSGQNILISFIFQPPIMPYDQFYFNQYFALSIRKFLAQFVENPQIKWPNDIYVQDDKIAGILIEHNIQGERIKYSIAGVGININQTIFEPVIENPTSLKLLTGENYNIHKLVQTLNNILQEEYYLLQEQDQRTLYREYLKHMYKYEQYDFYEIHGKIVCASIIGVTPFGQLMLEDLSGNPILCNYKEIRFINHKNPK